MSLHRRKHFFSEMQIDDLSFFPLYCTEMRLCKDEEVELLRAGLLDHLKETANPLASSVPLSGL